MEGALTIAPIGYVSTEMKLKFDAPHQPDNKFGSQTVVRLNPDGNYEQALTDLATFDRIWLVWWFHKNKTWRPKVLPPRGPAVKRGVFATRSPHRPNPIGISAVPLLGIQGRTLFLGNTDLIDGTPVLDIKPYVATVDSFPAASLGWLQEVEDSLCLPPQFSVVLSPIADEQCQWLREKWNVAFIERAVALLSIDPSPHRTRRIVRLQDGNLRMACGAWRIIFEASDAVVVIKYITPGYPDRVLQDPNYDTIFDREAQIAFNDFFGAELPSAVENKE